VDVRILAATNANLESLIQEKKFRSDLYYRLNVVNLIMPPLRDRPEDIPLLIFHFLERYTKENNKDVKGITRDAHKILTSYNWPGNVRELENIIERSVVLTQNNSLDIDDFSDLKSKNSLSGLHNEEVHNDEAGLAIEGSNFYTNTYLDSLDGKALEVIIGEVESRLIQYSLKKYRYTKTRVAKYLGINRNTLDKRIKELNIEY
jgi:Nif-specific regulatory protein